MAQSRSTTGKNRKQRKKALPSFFQILFSPLVLFWNSLHSQKKSNPQQLLSFFTLVTVLMGLTGLGVWIALEPSPIAATTLKLFYAPNKPSFAVPPEVTTIINANAARNNLDPNLINAIIYNESRFQAKAVSKAGARGMMQLIPAVWRQYSDSTCKGEHDPEQQCDAIRCIYDPKANIRVGSNYFCELLDRYNGRISLALEAYNAGMANVQPGTAPKYAETRIYIRNIINDWHQLGKKELLKQLQPAGLLWDGLKLFWVVVFGSWAIFLWWFKTKQ